MKRNIKRYFGLYWLGVALLLRFVFQANPYLMERVWMKSWFPVIRWMQSIIGHFLIVPGYFIAILALLIWIWVRFPRKMGRLETWTSFGRRLLNLLGGIAASFLMLWGYNYIDAGIGARMGLLKSTAHVDLAEAYLKAMEEARIARSYIEGVDSLEHIEQLTTRPEPEEIIEWVRNVLAPLGYPTSQNPRVRYIRPDGLLHRLSISGIYNPWTGEANVEGSLGALKGTFTAAHEIAHAFGVTSEAEANFVAFMACERSDNALGQYAARYSLWRGIGREVSRTLAPDVVQELASHIPEELLLDRKAIAQKQMQHRPYFPNTTTAMNDTYLKVQGVKGGVADYDGFIALYFALQNSDEGGRLLKENIDRLP